MPLLNTNTVKPSTATKAAPEKPKNPNRSWTCDKCHTPVRVHCGEIVCEGCPLPYIPTSAFRS